MWRKNRNGRGRSRNGGAEKQQEEEEEEVQVEEAAANAYNSNTKQFWPGFQFPGFGGQQQQQQPGWGGQQQVAKKINQREIFFLRFLLYRSRSPASARAAGTPAPLSSSGPPTPSARPAPPTAAGWTPTGTSTSASAPSAPAQSAARTPTTARGPSQRPSPCKGANCLVENQIIFTSLLLPPLQSCPRRRPQHQVQAEAGIKN